MRTMSKVNHFLDSKKKALHRQRRYETAHKKLSRARSCERGEYYYWGYAVTRQKWRVSCTWVRSPDGTKFPVPQYEKTGDEVFMVTRISKNAKWLKRAAAKKWRKRQINEESFADRGCTYKKDYDIPWTLL